MILINVNPTYTINGASIIRISISMGFVTNALSVGMISIILFLSAGSCFRDFEYYPAAQRADHVLSIWPAAAACSSPAHDQA
jgi:hypothetical protein